MVIFTDTPLTKPLILVNLIYPLVNPSVTVKKKLFDRLVTVVNWNSQLIIDMMLTQAFSWPLISTFLFNYHLRLRIFFSIFFLKKNLPFFGKLFTQYVVLMNLVLLAGYSSSLSCAENTMVSTWLFHFHHKWTLFNK